MFAWVMECRIAQLTLAVIVIFGRHNTTEAGLSGGVCPSDNSNEEIRCCLNHYAVNETCVECPPGSHGLNCSSRCIPGYFGFMCLNECKCLETQVCHKVTGCSEVQPNCKGDNCTHAIQFGEKFDEKNRTKVLLERTVMKTNYQKTLVAVLGTMTIILFAFGILNKVGVRYKTSHNPGKLLRGLVRSRVVRFESREENDNGNEYVDENLYSDIRASRMLTETGAVLDHHDPNVQSQLSSYPRSNQKENIEDRSQVQQYTAEYGFHDADSERIYNRLLLRENIPRDVCEYSQVSKTKRKFTVSSTDKDGYVPMRRPNSTDALNAIRQYVNDSFTKTNRDEGGFEQAKECYSDN